MTTNEMLFRRLGVFVGRFDLAAAAASRGWRRSRSNVVGDVVGRLVDKSLVVRRCRDRRSVAPPRDRPRVRTGTSCREWRTSPSTGPAPRLDLGRRRRSWNVASVAADEWEARVRRRRRRSAGRARRVAPRFAISPTMLRTRSRSPCGHLMYPRHFPAEAQSHYEEAAERANDDVSATVAFRAAACSRPRACGAAKVLSTAARRADRYESGGDDGAAAIALAHAVELHATVSGEYPEPIAFEESEIILRRARGLAPVTKTVAAGVATDCRGVAHSCRGRSRTEPSPHVPSRRLAPSATPCC